MTRKKRSSMGLIAVHIKRVYAPPHDGDGLRVLVDRLWPRGIARDKARIDTWLKDIAPSHDLRRRFHTKPHLWEEFNVAYAAELAQEPAKPHADWVLEQLTNVAVTLLYAASNEERNNAVVLRDWLVARMTK